jgi:thioredoxin-like negative regulator of GroEL
VGRINLVDKRENARTFKPKSVPTCVSFHKGRVTS